ncbi:MAG: hypothetical protein EB053_06645, partial [Chlamydiae bacterium]|nr:hypothetical protein [Chlamydiota bacterium]
AEIIFVPKNPETSVAFGSRVIARVQKEDIDTVLNGLKIQREIFEQIPDAATYFVPIPIVLRCRQKAGQKNERNKKLFVLKLFFC